MTAFLHLIKVPVLLLLFTSACAYAWFRTRGVTLRDRAAAAVVSSPAFRTEAIRIVPAPPSIDGWTVSEVESTHGQAERKDKATGWAVWPAFKAHFDKGVVDSVEALELK